MSGRDSWAVVKDSLTTQMRSGHEATVKPSLTVQVEAGRAADHFRGVTKMIEMGSGAFVMGKTGSATP